jgi:serine/threonine protein kinase
MEPPGPFDPYHTWLGIPPEEQAPNLYRLLGVRVFEDKMEVIEHAADQRMAHLRALQTGRHGALSQQVLNEVAAARICLLNAEKRAAYDAELRQKLAAAGPPPLPPATPEQTDDIDGTVFDHYLLLDLLAQTRTGPIFKARHRPMNRAVAIKIVSGDGPKKADVVARFYRKVQILAGLEHPNLVTAYDAGERDGTHYLVMEHVDGRDLGTMLREIGPLPVAHAVNYVMQAASGLGYAHAHAVYHRNVKPTNLLVDRQGVVKVVGFGLARIEGGPLSSEESPREELTMPGFVLGTREYMAPEQMLSSCAADHLSDIYGLGCTLHTLLIGRPPYVSKPQGGKMTSPLKGPIPSLSQQRPDVPASVDAVFRRMLAPRREERPQSMAEVIESLQDVRRTR